MSRRRTLKEIQEDIRTLTRVPLEFIHAKLDELAEEVGELGNPGWIPCSERSPEISIGDRCSEDVITVLKWYDGDITYSIGWYNKSGSWNEDCDNCKVIAWMPLPEPYKEDKDE